MDYFLGLLLGLTKIPAGVGFFTQEYLWRFLLSLPFFNPTFIFEELSFCILADS